MKTVNINDIAFESFRRYFKTLSQFGFKDKTSINKLIVLYFTRNLINDKDFILHKKHYKIINEMLACIYGSICLIPYPNEILIPEQKKLEKEDKVQDKNTSYNYINNYFNNPNIKIYEQEIF